VRPFNRIVRRHFGSMRTYTRGLLTLAALLMPQLAHADSDAYGDLGILYLKAYAVIYYVILCLFSVPLSLLLRGSKLMRVAIGFVTPLIGVGLGAMALIWLNRERHMHYLLDYMTSDRELVFFVISGIPMVVLFTSAAVSRAKAEALERSRVQYAEYLEREKGLAALAKANVQRANDA